MHDAVADILGERKRLGRSGPAGFVVSLVLHAALGLLFVMAARGHRATDLRPVLSVRFAPAKAAGVRPSAPAAQKSRPAPKSETPAKEPEKEPEKTKAPPVEKSLWGRSEKKPKEDARPEPAAESDEASTRIPGTDAGGRIGGVPGIGTAGVTGLEGGDFPYTIYIDRMLTIIGRNWFRPQTRTEPLVQVYFVIERDGRIRDPKVETSSGSSGFDRAALRAIIESSPLPPLPFGYSGTELGVHLTFH